MLGPSSSEGTEPIAAGFRIAVRRTGNSRWRWSLRGTGVRSRRSRPLAPLHLSPADSRPILCCLPSRAQPPQGRVQASIAGAPQGGAKRLHPEVGDEPCRVDGRCAAGRKKRKEFCIARQRASVPGAWPSRWNRPSTSRRPEFDIESGSSYNNLCPKQRDPGPRKSREPEALDKQAGGSYKGVLRAAMCKAQVARLTEARGAQAPVR